MRSDPEDLVRLATADDRDRAHGFVCPCGARPTCPMLLDTVWDQIKPEPVVTIKVLNLRNGEKREHRTERVLLCMTCAETRLGRELTVDDLANCVGNYGAAIMLQRALARDASARALARQILDVAEQDGNEYEYGHSVCELARLVLDR